MAADSSAPWSRWDAPGFQYVSTNTQPTVQQAFNLGGVNGVQYNGVPNGQIQYGGPVVPNGIQRDANGNFNGFFARTMLVQTNINSLDPSFYDCVYGVANSAGTVIEQCYKDIGCCATTCCYNGAWEDRYGWAVALIVIFCILVLVAMGCTLGCWLFNRAADKTQKNDLLTNAGLSPAASQLSLAPPPVAATNYGPAYGSPDPYRY